MAILYGTIAQAVVLLPIEGGTTTLGSFETNSWKNLHQEPLKFSWYQPAPLPMTWDQFAPEAKVSLSSVSVVPSSGFRLFEATPNEPTSFVGYQRTPEPVAQMPGPTTLATWTPPEQVEAYSNDAGDVTMSTRRRSLGLMAMSVSPIGPGNHGYDPNRIAVPEIPQGTLLAAGGLLGLAGLRRRLRRK